MLCRINAPLILTGKDRACGRQGILNRAHRAVMTALRAFRALQSRDVLGCGQLERRSWPKLYAKQKTHRQAVGFCLARCKGFEPPTYWFVARHSIQLS